MDPDKARKQQQDDEAAVVDRLLKKLPYADPTLRRDPPAGRGPTTPRYQRPGVLVGRPTLPGMVQPLSRKEHLAIWARVGLAAVFGLAITQWPYAHDCGFPLALYLTGVLTVIVGGVWGSLSSWKGRLGWAHLVSVLTIVWGLALVTQQVLPRVGYAKADASWRCRVVRGL